MNLVIFDIDDTLTKSEYQHQLAYVRAMRDLGIENINQNWKEYDHHTDSYILKINYENNFDKVFDLTPIPSFESKMAEIMATLKSVVEIPGAKSLVDYLRQKNNYAITFATGSFKKPAVMKLRQTGIWHDENLLATSNQFFSREQIVNDSILKARSYYQVQDFDKIISIGDGIWDLKTAKNLNLDFIGVGLKNLEDFRENNVTFHTENWENFEFEKIEKQLFNQKYNN